MISEDFFFTMETVFCVFLHERVLHFILLNSPQQIIIYMPYIALVMGVLSIECSSHSSVIGYEMQRMNMQTSFIPSG